jgi:hypothetical protein
MRGTRKALTWRWGGGRGYARERGGKKRYTERYLCVGYSMGHKVGKVNVQRLVRVPYESRHKVGVDGQGHHLDIQKKSCEAGPLRYNSFQ